MPYHFVSIVNHDLNEGLIEPSDVLVLHRPGAKYKELVLPALEFIQGFKHLDKAENQDLAMVLLPKRFNCLRDITHLIASKKQLESYVKVESILLIPGSEAREFHSLLAKSSENSWVESDDFEGFGVKETFQYNTFTARGDCGSILFVSDKLNHKPVVGMHVAGSVPSRIGFSTKIWIELIEEYIAMFDIRTSTVLSDEVMVITPEVGRENMVCHGVVTNHKVPRNATKSKIVKSPLYGLVSEVVRAPAKLAPFSNSEGKLVNPMKIALDGYGHEDVHIEHSLLIEGLTSLGDYLERHSHTKVTKEVYSFETAVLGIPGGDFASIPRNKSAGFPHCVRPGLPTKARFFGTEDEFDFRAMSVSN